MDSYINIGSDGSNVTLRRSGGYNVFSKASVQCLCNNNYQTHIQKQYGQPCSTRRFIQKNDVHMCN